MNFGLIGWGIASGNGGMNSDICLLAPWVTHWLIPDHPSSSNHQPYLDRLSHTKIVSCKLTGDESKCIQFLSEIDGLLYVEHPCLKDSFNIVLKAKQMGKVVVGIPMWEWWPERKDWALNTDILWSVTKFTAQYLNSLSDVLYVHGFKHRWRHRVFGSRWGVNLEDFPFKLRKKIQRVVFVNGNGGYKLRKASDLVFDAFSNSNAPPLTVYTQQTEKIAEVSSSNITVIDKVFPNRCDVYSEGDLFLFPSYWEGLCHGIYEAQACGGVVITTDHPPMNECMSPFLISLKNLTQEDLDGKKIVKAIASSEELLYLVNSLYSKDLSTFSKNGHDNIVNYFNLRDTLSLLHECIVGVC